MSGGQPGSAFRYRSCHCSMLVDLHDADYGRCACEKRPIRAVLHSVPQRVQLAGHGYVIVPTNRRPDAASTPGLAHASELSTSLGWDLVVLCSGQSRPEDVYWSGLVHRSALLIDVAAVDTSWLPELPSHTHELSACYRADTGRKRNLALAMAFHQCKQYALFVDDDIRVDDPDETGAARPTMDLAGVRAAVQLLKGERSHELVGWVSRYQADNSMVGHSRRAAGLPQGIFLGGNALLTRVTGQVPSFPTIYNEDWFFSMEVRARASVPARALVRAGSVWQTPYRVYRAPRAISEEPGDQVAENLMNLVENHGKTAFVLACDPKFWAEAQRSRQHLIADLGRSLRNVPASKFGALVGDTGQHPRKVLSAALQRNRELSPQMLASFVRSRRADHGRWTSFLADEVRSLSLPMPFSSDQEQVSV